MDMPAGRNTANSRGEMSLGDIIDSAVRLYRDNFQLFFGVTAVLYIPAALLTIALTADKQVELMQLVQAQAGTSGGVEQDLDSTLRLFSLLGEYMLLSLPFYLIVQPIVAGTITFTANLRLNGEEVSISGAYKGFMKIFWGYLSAVVMYSLAWILGGFLLFVPGMLAAIVFSLTQESAVVEKAYGTRALSRSWELTRKHWGKVFLLGLLLFMISAVISYGIKSIADFALGVDSNNAEGLTAWAMALSGFVSSLVQIAILPFWHISWLFLYYDLESTTREMDVRNLAESLVKALPGRAGGSGNDEPGDFIR
ncbi:MAG: hypothetical protein GXP49_07670 [Deltaproteobacteria bacterium]|nr:hypothetical protein [Deltaproteobacteria bacterium]